VTLAAEAKQVFCGALFETYCSYCCVQSFVTGSGKSTLLSLLASKPTFGVNFGIWAVACYADRRISHKHVIVVAPTADVVNQQSLCRCPAGLSLDVISH